MPHAEEGHARLASRVLAQAGFAPTEAEAEAWLRCGRHARTADIIVRGMAPWIDVGVAPAEAARWWRAGVPVRAGVSAVQRGWTLREFRALMLLESTHRKSQSGIGGDYQVVLEAWICSDIPAGRALRYREAGLTVLAARDLEEQREGGKPIDEAMAAILALRREPGPSQRWSALLHDPDAGA